MIFHCIPRSTNVVCASPFWWIEELEKIIDANAMVIIFSIWAHVGTNPISNILKLWSFPTSNIMFLPGPTLIGFPTTKDTLWMILGCPHFRKHQETTMPWTIPPASWVATSCPGAVGVLPWFSNVTMGMCMAAPSPWPENTKGTAVFCGELWWGALKMTQKYHF